MCCVCSGLTVSISVRKHKHIEHLMALKAKPNTCQTTPPLAIFPHPSKYLNISASVCVASLSVRMSICPLVSPTAGWHSAFTPFFHFPSQDAYCSVWRRPPLGWWKAPDGYMYRVGADSHLLGLLIVINISLCVLCVVYEMLFCGACNSYWCQIMLNLLLNYA